MRDLSPMTGPTGAETPIPFYGQLLAVRTIVFNRPIPPNDSESLYRQRDATPGNSLGTCLDQKIKTEQFEQWGHQALYHDAEHFLVWRRGDSRRKRGRKRDRSHASELRMYGLNRCQVPELWDLIGESETPNRRRRVIPVENSPLCRSKISPLRFMNGPAWPRTISKTFGARHTGIRRSTFPLRYACPKSVAMRGEEILPLKCLV